MHMVYNAYGNQKIQISDNGAPFGSNKMKIFDQSRDISKWTLPACHPSSNTAKTFMKP